MKFSTIAVLLLAAANSAHANYDEVAIKEQKIAEEVRTAAANLEKAEEALEKKQNGIRGGQVKPVRTGTRERKLMRWRIMMKSST